MRRFLRSPHLHPGIAVPGVLYLIIVIGFLVATGMFTVARMRRGTAHRLLDVSLGAAADDALAGALLDWPGEARSRLSVGATDSVRVQTRTSEPTHAIVRVVRLSPTLFYLVADVRADRWPEAGRRVNLIVRVRPLPRMGLVALASRGDVILGAAARLLPDSGAVCDGVSAVPLGIGAVAVAPDGHVALDPGRASADSVRIIVPDTTDSLSLMPLGDEWQRLTARADLRLAPGSSVAASDHALAWVQGDLTLHGGVGSGVLLVDGRLTLAGPLTFTGVIVARGGVITASDGVAITGFLASTARSDSGRTPVALVHAIDVRASRCAALRALIAAIPPVPVHGRAWAELF